MNSNPIAYNSSDQVSVLSDIQNFELNFGFIEFCFLRGAATKKKKTRLKTRFELRNSTIQVECFTHITTTLHIVYTFPNPQSMEQ